MKLDLKLKKKKPKTNHRSNISLALLNKVANYEDIHITHCTYSLQIASKVKLVLGNDKWREGDKEASETPYSPQGNNVSVAFSKHNACLWQLDGSGPLQKLAVTCHATNYAQYPQRLRHLTDHTTNARLKISQSNTFTEGSRRQKQRSIPQLLPPFTSGKHLGEGARRNESVSAARPPTTAPPLPQPPRGLTGRSSPAATPAGSRALRCGPEHRAVRPVTAGAGGAGAGEARPGPALRSPRGDTHQFPEPTMHTLRGAPESAMAAPPAPRQWPRRRAP